MMFYFVFKKKKKKKTQMTIHYYLSEAYNVQFNVVANNQEEGSVEWLGDKISRQITFSIMLFDL